MNEISCKNLCLCIRNGVEIWLENSRVDNLRKLLSMPNVPQFITLPDQQLINRSDIVGVFSPTSMESLTERKNGIWHCKQGTPHGKSEKCDCIPNAKRKMLEKQQEAIKKCPLGCQEGYIYTDGNMSLCSCLAELKIDE